MRWKPQTLVADIFLFKQCIVCLYSHMKVSSSVYLRRKIYSTRLFGLSTRLEPGRKSRQLRARQSHRPSPPQQP